jgi:hypothetical protein
VFILSYVDGKREVVKPEEILEGGINDDERMKEKNTTIFLSSSFLSAGSTSPTSVKLTQ